MSEYFLESFYNPELIVRRFEPFLAEEMLKDSSDMFCIAFAHRKKCYVMFPPET